MSRRNHVQVTLGLVFGGVMILVSIFQFRAASARSSEATVLLAADSYLRALEAVRAVYTSEVVNRLPDSLVVTYDYTEYEHAIPLPATFTIALAQNLGTSIEGLEVRLYSEYPFPFRGRPDMDGFEQLAMDSLAALPSAAISAIEGRGTERILRYALADTMRSECVACHNSHPDSPKTDWEVGDLRGVLAISIPLASFEQRAREARSPYTMLLLLALIGLMAAFVMLLEYFPNLPGQGTTRKD